MSLENELKRIADSLEVIAVMLQKDAVGADTAPEVEEQPKQTTKKKAKKKAASKKSEKPQEDSIPTPGETAADSAEFHQPDDALEVKKEDFRTAVKQAILELGKEKTIAIVNKYGYDPATKYINAAKHKECIAELNKRD